MLASSVAGLFLKNLELRQDQKNVMDIIWDGNPSNAEVINRCGWDENTNYQAERTKLNAKIKWKKFVPDIVFFSVHRMPKMLT